MLKTLVPGLLLAVALPVLAVQPVTAHVDYFHSGDAEAEQYAIERVVIEPLPWPGNMQRTIDQTNRGNNMVEVTDAKTGKLLRSGGYSTVFVEWASTEEAGKLSCGFEESVRLRM